jgi:hypothetical protein
MPNMTVKFGHRGTVSSRDLFPLHGVERQATKFITQVYNFPLLFPIEIFKSTSYLILIPISFSFSNGPPVQHTHFKKKTAKLNAIRLKYLFLLLLRHLQMVFSAKK